MLGYVSSVGAEVGDRDQLVGLVGEAGKGIQTGIKILADGIGGVGGTALKRDGGIGVGPPRSYGQKTQPKNTNPAKETWIVVESHG